MKIAFIIGELRDIYKYKYTSKYLPKWLKNGLKPLTNWINKDKTIPVMVAVAVYIMYKHRNTIVDCLKHKLVNRKLLDEYDVIFTLYDSVDVFHCGLPPHGTCPSEAHKYERILQATKAFVYPFPNFHNYIINKPYYYSNLRKAGLPIVPYFRANPVLVVKNIKKFKAKVMKKGWKGIIVKPSYAGYSVGIQVFKNVSRTSASTFKKKFQELVNMSFPNVIVQEFVPSFGKNYEIRTYWINEKYAYSVATLKPEAAGLDVDYTTFKREGGKLDNSILQDLKPLGVQVLKSIRQYKYAGGSRATHPLVRIDFGCCIKQQDCPNSYFINEIETMAAYKLVNKTRFPATQRIADAVYKFSTKVVGKQEPKPVKSKHIATYKVPYKKMTL